MKMIPIRRPTTLALMAILAFAPIAPAPARADIVANKIRDGEVVPAKHGVQIRNESGSTMAAGSLVYVSGWSETQKRFLVTKADADATGARAIYILRAALPTASNAQAYKTYRQTAVATNGAAVGDPVYLSTTAGTFTLTAPASANSVQQIVGRVAVVNASTGQIEYDLMSNNTVAPLVAGTGYIPLSIATAREVLTNDIGNAATAAATGSGGILAKDTTPILERVNVGTDQQLRVAWAASNNDPITWSFVSPPDLNASAVVTVKILAAMSGATNTPTVGVAVFEGVGGSDLGGNTGAVTGTTVATYSKTFTASAAPKPLTITLTPAAHAADALRLYGVWIEYTKQ